MGSRNYLIEGISGAGKTTVAEELQRRGYHVIHGDRELAYYGDPETGAPLGWPPHDSESEKVRWGHEHWIWPVEKVRALAADQSHPVTFFCGGTRNLRHFRDVFDGIFVLDVDPGTLDRRLSGRPEDEFGGRLVEQALIKHLHVTQEDMPEGAVHIDSTQPVAQIVDTIFSQCDAPEPTIPAWKATDRA